MNYPTCKGGVIHLKRVVRALEVYYTTGTPISRKQKEAEGIYGKLPVRIFGLRWERNALYRRIDKRVDFMFSEGGVGEVKNLLNRNLSITAEKIIGVKEIAKFLQGECSEEEAKQEMKKNTRRLAKRQMTWFKKDKRVEWIDVDNLTPEEIKEEILSKI